MKTKLVHPGVMLMVSTLLLVSLTFAMAGCTNTGAYKHTTVVKASVDELNINALGAAPLIQVKEGTLTVTITTQISLGNAVTK